jgi:hypothetical protein
MKLCYAGVTVEEISSLEDAARLLLITANHLAKVKNAELPKGVPALPLRIGGNYPLLRLGQKCYGETMQFLGTWNGKEQGGLWFGRAGEDVVSLFVPDEHGLKSNGTFAFDTQRMKATIQHLGEAHWECQGVVHSQPPGCRRLSPQDLTFAKNLFRGSTKDTMEVWMPVVSDTVLYPYLLLRGLEQEPMHTSILLV